MEPDDCEENRGGMWGFVEIDERTRSMGEIQWARILVKIRGEFRPSMLEIEMMGGSAGEWAGLRAWNQIHGPMPRDWAYSDGKMAGSSSYGPTMGFKEQEKDGGGPLGRKLKDKTKVVGELEAGPSSSNWAVELGCHSLWRWKEIRREQRDDGFSMTDRALEEEDKRYVLHSHPKGNRVMETFLSLSSNSDRAPEGESFDRPGGIEEELWGDKSTWLTIYEGNVENEYGSWKLGEANKNRDKVRGKEGNAGPQDLKTPKMRKRTMEECSLAKFSQFLGFSTEGLEREILNFLTKIRKRREKDSQQRTPGEDQIERELKRLECSVIMRRNKQKGNQDSGDVGGIVRSLGTGRFIDWRALNAEGAAGGILICWDKRGGGIRRGPTPFRFENMWLKVEGFQDIVRTWWQGIEVRGSASYRLTVKMKEIKKKLKVWNKEEAKDSFKKWVLLEEAHWRQHSREIVREGDRNTGFFHRMVSAHRRNNAMGRIKVNGEWLVEEQEVGCISQQEAESLEIPFAEIEIHSALMEMNGDKAPGSDGFTVAFWQNAWTLPKRRSWRCLKNFMSIIPLSFKKWALGQHRGLCQGDPLSPYLFVMGMEILDVLIRRAVEGDIFQGATFGVGAGWGLCPPIFGSPFRVPIGLLLCGMEVEERQEETCALEKTVHLQRGRITLIKSTLASMPIYQMSIFRMPKSLLKEWRKPKEISYGGGNWRGKVHLVKWDVVCTEKLNGGLGLRRIATLNRALLGKWTGGLRVKRITFGNK
ncbi:hypothetical protein CK203_066945 [Vitis vinifera]|uniref:Uncharacterized protein n=1 Tax=Vitis vinifera TaxID=29760 RepID=A0A438F5D5_VITVI|nr:hypothetical protein CK203_066945 [Vitis vinifera]